MRKHGISDPSGFNTKENRGFSCKKVRIDRGDRMRHKGAFGRIRSFPEIFQTNTRSNRWMSLTRRPSAPRLFCSIHQPAISGRFPQTHHPPAKTIMARIATIIKKHRILPPSRRHCIHIVGTFERSLYLVIESRAWTNIEESSGKGRYKGH